jgi:DNA-binding NarL/FixJ family response regulator
MGPVVRSSDRSRSPAENSDGPVLPTSRRDELAVRGPGALTQREREVLALIASGLDNRVIAEDLCISVNTLEHHITAVFAKLNVDTRVRAVVRAYQLGLAPYVADSR